MAKKTALNKREREKVKKALLERRAALMSDIDGTEQEIDELQDPKADDLDRAVEAELWNSWLRSAIRSVGS